jgi:hypothetical protein
MPFKILLRSFFLCSYVQCESFVTILHFYSLFLLLETGKGRGGNLYPTISDRLQNLDS